MNSQLLLLLLAITSISVGFRTQSVSVKGTLMCGDEPAKNVKVKLMDQDAGSGPDPDDFIAQDYTDDNGFFEVSGSSQEITPIDPEIRIYHDCNDMGRPCKRKWKIRIPNKYIYDGENPKESMNLGTINLEVELEQESASCS